MYSTARRPFRALIVGGGVAGLEAALALRELAAERVTCTLLAPQAEFVYRPMRVREPFALSEARRYPLEEIASDLDAELIQDAFDWLDPEHRLVHTAGGQMLGYDALLLAPGATLRRPFAHALTLDDSQLDEQLHGLIRDVEGGYVESVVFVAPSPMPWPLPLYELALMTARRAFDMNVEVSITIATPEETPLAVFGRTASDATAELLVGHGIATLTSAHCEVPRPGRVIVHPGSRRLDVDRIVALPQLAGPRLRGVPTPEPDGFLPIDPYCRVRSLERVYAAGDATDFPVKHGGIAAQQADTAARSIAALAGAPLEPEPFRPVIHGVLLGGDKPLYLSAHLTGGHGSTSQIGETPTWTPASKISAVYLAPYLESRDRAAVR
jgi:sulfide:quinone oxidoreductase